MPETGSSAQNVVAIAQSAKTEGWTEVDLKGLRGGPRGTALLSGNKLTQEMVKVGEVEGVEVVDLHWSVCRMCGKLHHSLMMHILDEDGKVIAISATGYERLRYE